MIDGTGSVIGGLCLLLRLEGVAVLALAVALYTRTGDSWLLFGALLLAPDLALLAYLGGPSLGAVAYNALHTYVGPAVVVAYCQGVGSVRPSPWSGRLTSAWTARSGST